MAKKKAQARRDAQAWFPGGGKRLVAMIAAVAIGAGVGVLIWRIATPASSTPESALSSAETRFEAASRAFVSGMRKCGTGPSRLRCSETQDRAWGQAFEQLASSLSTFSFPSAQAAQADALISDARQIGHGLLVASRAKTLSAHFNAFLVAQGLLPHFAQDAQLLLGHGL